MKVYRLEVIVIDFDQIGPLGVKGAIENTKYPNHCITPNVRQIDERDIGDWSDDHPLNRYSTFDAAVAELFKA